MCKLCGSYPCVPGCPNAETKVKTCVNCREDIHAGYKYFSSQKGPICEECMVEMPIHELLELFGEEMEEA